MSDCKREYMVVLTLHTHCVGLQLSIVPRPLLVSQIVLHCLTYVLKWP